MVRSRCLPDFQPQATNDAIKVYARDNAFSQTMSRAKSHELMSGLPENRNMRVDCARCSKYTLSEPGYISRLCCSKRKLFMLITIQ